MSEKKNDVPDTNDGNIYECSCGYGWDKTKVVRHHFCPNCGMPVDERVRSVDGPVAERVVDPEDCICRWEVLDLLHLQYFGKDLYMKIATLPSVKTKPKTAHWVKIEPYPFQMNDYECSECLHETNDNTEEYCSSCGCKMEVEE